ncbi:hypothetical protein [Neobacillus dielmonensis]|uniref:hypothetical protein n=1 Tax=Neobacillus dielmonensis TaxID=1347369 RepID=UPI0005AB7688|nr:hypothetical protein [Neobacillus dielmonensis]
MIALKQTTKSAKNVIILILMISALIIPTKHSLAVEDSTIGFIIEASQMEGTPLGILPTLGETANQKAQPMLEFKFANCSVQGLTIKKLVKTQNGIVMTKITSKDTVQFKTLSLKVSNAEFKQIYAPELGKIGFRDIKLLAHDVNSSHATLPQFALEFETDTNLELQPKNEQELQTMKSTLENLIQTLLKSDAN